jgi:26S proteasome non-ATPase regulatory subunit 9
MDPSNITEEHVEDLVKQKDTLEKEISNLIKYLKAPGNLGLSGGLIDAEGFPIADVGKIIDVRTARHNLACKQNDHIAIMKEIEEGLYALHENYKLREKPVSTTKRETPKRSEEKIEVQPLKKAFAFVAEVTLGSPSAQCGLQKDDLILEFGSVHYENNRALKAVADVVQENTPVKLHVLRDSNSVYLTLIPAKWEGRGLLGCHIKPYS